MTTSTEDHLHDWAAARLRLRLTPLGHPDRERLEAEAAESLNRARARHFAEAEGDLRDKAEMAVSDMADSAEDDVKDEIKEWPKP